MSNVERERERCREPEVAGALLNQQASAFPACANMSMFPYMHHTYTMYAIHLYTGRHFWITKCKSGEEELTMMIKEDGGAAMQCHFCDTDYQFTALDLVEVVTVLKEKAKNK